MNEFMPLWCPTLVQLAGQTHRIMLIYIYINEQHIGDTHEENEQKNND